MQITPEISGVSVVFLGSFNPKIFRPSWFSENGLLTDAEARAADIQVIHNEIAIFETEWLKIQVQQNNFRADVLEPNFVRLRDLLVRSFGEYLTHTPIGVMGINRAVHFRVGGIDVRDKIGETLAPRGPWGEWGERTIAGEGAKHGGLTNLTLEERSLDDRFKGHIQVKIEPSVEGKIPQGDGVHMQVNDHYEIENAANVSGCSEVIRKLSECFEISIDRSEGIIDIIMGLANELRRSK